LIEHELLEHDLGAGAGEIARRRRFVQRMNAL
jgi:hypothetical protein